MLARSSKRRMIDLYYLTGYKRIRAGELGLKDEFIKLSQTKDYVESAIGAEFNIKWNES